MFVVFSGVDSGSEMIVAEVSSGSDTGSGTEIDAVVAAGVDVGLVTGTGAGVGLVTTTGTVETTGCSSAIICRLIYVITARELRTSSVTHLREKDVPGVVKINGCPA
jgi:hypothetical protein